MASRYEEHIGGGASGGSGPPPLPGGDHFAPTYLVGNVLAGYPAVAQVAPFRYIPDPGDGSGIELALAEAFAVPGHVVISEGVFTRPAGATRLSIENTSVVSGQGYGTEIISGPDDNGAFNISGAGELSHVRIRRAAGALAVVGSELVSMIGGGGKLTDVTISYEAAVGGIVTACVRLTSSNTLLRASVLRDVLIEMPDGVGGTNTALWMAGVGGVSPVVAPARHIVLLSNVVTDRGDVGFMTLGADLELDACFMRRPRRMGIYALNGRVTASGRQSVIMLSRVGGGELAGCQLIDDTFSLRDLQITLDTPAAIPAVYVSGGAGVASALIDGCEIGTGFNPQMQIGNAAEVVQDTRIVNNKIAGAAGTVPIAAGTGSTNCSAALNISRGSGSTLPTDLGTGNQIAPGVANIWGA